MNEWTEMSLEDVKKRVIAAICALYRHDRELLAVDANERSITHKLAEQILEHQNLMTLKRKPFSRILSCTVGRPVKTSWSWK